MTQTIPPEYAEHWPRVKLEELADCCERRTGPDRELDCAIGVAIGLFEEHSSKYDHIPFDYWRINSDGAHSQPGHGGDQMVPRYTASIDAALTLVPDQCRWSLDVGMGDDRMCQVAIWFSTLAGRAATPALALIAASLRARSAQS